MSISEKRDKNLTLLLDYQQHARPAGHEKSDSYYKVKNQQEYISILILKLWYYNDIYYNATKFLLTATISGVKIGRTFYPITVVSTKIVLIIVVIFIWTIKVLYHRYIDHAHESNNT